MGYSVEVMQRARARLAAAKADRESENQQHLAQAYERTCLNTGGLNWAYMNKILQRWHEAGLHTAEAIRTGDRKPAAPRGASGELGEAERAAIQRLLSEV